MYSILKFISNGGLINKQTTNYRRFDLYRTITDNRNMNINLIIVCNENNKNMSKIVGIKNLTNLEKLYENLIQKLFPSRRYLISRF